MSTPGQNKAPGAVAAAAEGGIPTQQGRDMTNTTPTPAAAKDPEMFRDWARAYAASWNALIAKALQHPAWGVIEATGGAIVEDFYQHIRKLEQWRAPELPSTIWPAWATRGRVGTPTGGEVPIWINGPEHGEGETATWVQEFYSVRIANSADSPAGDFIHEPAQIRWHGDLDNELTLSEARALRDNLTAAINLLASNNPENER